jgi:transposase
MPAPLSVPLSPAQEAELAVLRDHAATPYLRERAGAVLKVAAGWSVRRVARDGLLRPRRPETVAAWVRRYLAEGAAGLGIRPGRGRKPAFSPPRRGRRRRASA